jgi:hypothetical protein
MPTQNKELIITDHNTEDLSSFAQKLKQKDGIFEVVKKQNTLFITADADTFSQFSNDTPNHLNLLELKKQTTDKESNRNYRKHIILELTKNNPQNTAQYTDKLMVFLKLQLELFPAVNQTAITRDKYDDELKITVKLTDPLDKTTLFTPLLKALGGQIEYASATENGFTCLTIGWDKKSHFDLQTVDEFRTRKLQRYRKYHFDTSEPIRGPCGHKVSPNLAAFKYMTENSFKQFPLIKQGNYKFRQIEIDNSKPSPYPVTNWPSKELKNNDNNSKLPVYTQRGYFCETCNIHYTFDSTKNFERTSNIHLPAIQHTINTKDKTFQTLIFEKPFRSYLQLKENF